MCGACVDLIIMTLDGDTNSASDNLTRITEGLVKDKSALIVMANIPILYSCIKVFKSIFW